MGKYEISDQREIFYHHSVSRGNKEYGVTVCLLAQNGFAHARGISVRMPGDLGPRSLGLKSRAFGNKLARERAQKALKLHGNLRPLKELAYSLVKEACSYDFFHHYGETTKFGFGPGLALSIEESELIKKIYTKNDKRRVK